MRAGKLGKRRETAPITLNCGHNCPRVDERPRQPTRARAYLISVLIVKIARDRRDTIEQLMIQQKVLTERLAGAQAMPRNDIAQRRTFCCQAA